METRRAGTGEECGGNGRRKRGVVVVRERGKRRGTIWRMLRVKRLFPMVPDKVEGYRNDKGCRQDESGGWD